MISRFFIYRPIFASVVSIFIILVGVISLPLLPIEQTPDITPPTVAVSAAYPGASAQSSIQCPVRQSRTEHQNDRHRRPGQRKIEKRQPA